MKADSVYICFVTKHHYTTLSWFSFSLFYILLFSVHIVNVDAAESSTVLDNLSVNIYVYISIYIYTYIYIYIFFLSSGRNLRTITCLLFPYNQSNAFLDGGCKVVP